MNIRLVPARVGYIADVGKAKKLVHRITTSVSIFAGLLVILLLGAISGFQPSAAAQSSYFCDLSQFVGQFYRVAVTSVDPSTSPTTGQTVTANVRLQSIYGFPATNKILYWQVTGPNSSTASPSSGTVWVNWSGTAQISYTNTKAGQDTLTVWYELSGDNTLNCGEPNTSTTINWTPGIPTAIVVTPPASSVPAGQTQTETAMVTDQYGNAVADGTTVNWVVEGAIATTASPSSATSTTTSGQADFSYSNTSLGTDTVRAFIDSISNGSYDNGEVTGTASVTWIPGPPATISLAPSSATNTVGTSHMVTATVKDQVGNNVADGTVIHWVIEGPNSGTASPEIGSSATTSGQTKFSYTNTKPGTDTIRAFFDSTANGSYDVGEVTGTATKTWIAGPAAFLSVMPSNPTNTVGQKQTETATVTDQYGNNVADGTTVNWVVEGPNAASAAPASGTSGTTNGQATFSYSNTKSGADTARAFIDSVANGIYDNGELTGTANVTWSPDVPATITLSPTTATVLLNGSQTETATVTDQYGNNVADGTTIHWVIEGTNSGTASPSNGTSTTANGQATFSYSNSTAGTDTVRAFFDSVSNGTYDTGEPTGTASITWYYPSPVAANDTYTATGNVQISVPSGSGLFSNDTLNSATLGPVDTTGTQGNVSVNSDGSFTYNPKPGFTGSDTFSYTLTNTGGTSTATVTINVSHMIWFINNDSNAPSGNDGRLTSPFNSLSSFATAGGGTTGDVIFIYSGTAAYTGGLSLKDSQTLLGQGVDLSSNLGFAPAPYSATLPGSASNPTITNGSGNGISLGQNNTIKGLTVGNTSGYGISGTSVGTLTIGSVTVNGTGGIANLVTGTLAATLDSASSTNSAGYGLYLSGASGSLTVNGTTNVVNPSSGGIAISSSGTLTTTLSGLTITNSSATGFSASSAGTIVLTGSSNTISTTSGTALSITGTTIGASGMTFRSISSSGAANGVVLSNTGSGAFTVTGTGSAGTGGTIQNISTNGIALSNANHVSLSDINLTNANTSNGSGTCDGTTNSGCNAAINLNTVSDLTLDHIAISGGVQQGINGINVTTMALSNSTIQNVGNQVNEHGIYIFGLFGTQSGSTANSITNTSVSGSYDSNVFIRNSTATNSSASSPDRLSVSGSTFSTSTTGEGLTISSRSTANFQLDLQSSTFNNNPTVAVHVDAGDTSRNDFSMSSSTVSGSTVGVDVSGSGTSTSTFNVANNTGSGISVLSGSGIVIASNSSSVMSGTVQNNIVTTTDSTNPSFGIDVVVDSTGSATVKIDGNSVSAFMTGIRGGARNAGTGHADLTITNNTLNNTANSFPYSAMLLFSGNGSQGESNVVCANVSGNQFTTGAGNYDIELDKFAGNTFNIQGLSPATGATETQIETYLSNLNNSAQVIAAGGNDLSFTAGTCSLP